MIENLDDKIVKLALKFYPPDKISETENARHRAIALCGQALFQQQEEFKKMLKSKIIRKGKDIREVECEHNKFIKKILKEIDKL